MSSAFKGLKYILTLGSDPQNFLGTRWIPFALGRLPEKKRRKWALRTLSLSPHYFFDNDRGEKALDENLEERFSEALRSRKHIFELLLKDRLNENDVVLDYGCGPGFLAANAAPFVKKLFACDISAGVLACARIINSAPNLTYVRADDEGMATIADGSIDAVYSFAVIQHLTDETFERVLANCSRKLRPGGRLILHIQLSDDIWRSEEEWKSDTSVKGKLKFRYGLHCFGRSAERHRELVEKHNFTNVSIEPLSDEAAAELNGTKAEAMLIASRSQTEAK
ncbi:MAG: type 11 methyltransferase [Acidobacteria bacterium OLB17]|nr:MAG: type 11 methyltransferase [Acidobacteria bacterium OLB17]MCZ2391668.1 class I SAM-dependent methyltransferase [Acidobacteriota bacterium]